MPNPVPGPFPPIARPQPAGPDPIPGVPYAPALGPPFKGPPGTESWWPTDIDPATLTVPSRERTGSNEMGDPIYGVVQRPMSPQELLEHARKGGLGPEVAKKARAATRIEPEIVSLGGEDYVFNPATGSFDPVRKSSENFDSLIVRAIADGDWDTADRLQQFRNQPSDLDLFKAAMDYAKSPADAYTISALARGEQAAPSTGPGDLKRLGPPSGAVTESYNRLFAPRPAVPAKPTRTAPPDTTVPRGDDSEYGYAPTIPTPPIAGLGTQAAIIPPETTANAQAHAGTQPILVGEKGPELVQAPTGTRV